jgi:acetylornithine deacetylase/succinyl-diaminopimelate desuccinylase-like protein
LATLPKAPHLLRAFPQARLAGQIANRPGFADAQRWFARERGWINDVHLQLCRIPAATFFERPRAEWFRLQLENLGWKAQLDRAGNVLASFGDEGRQRALVVSAHLDTVFAPNRPEDVYVAPDGRIVGPGTSDNGSGLAAVLALARVLREYPELHELAASLLLVANVGEEGEGNLSGMRYLCQSLRAQRSPEMGGLRGFVVLDGPSTEHITAQALASWRYELTFTGMGGHTWNDHGTPNPVHALSDAIAGFVRSADAFAFSGNRPQCSYNFSVLEGGTSINSIPASARAKLDIRSEDPATLNELAAMVSGAVERSLEHANRTAKGSRLGAKIKDLGSRPGGKLPSDSPVLRAIQEVDAHFHIRSRLQCASTDANVPLSLGWHAISIGTGGHGGGSHTRDEWYQPDGREVGLRRILLLLGVLQSEFQETEAHAAE